MKIFISYKRNVEPDHDLAVFVEKQLSSEGHEVFRDQNCIAPGSEWPEKIQRELKACHLVIALVSNAALESDWVKNELQFAAMWKKRRLPVQGQRPLTLFAG